MRIVLLAVVLLLNLLLALASRTRRPPKSTRLAGAGPLAAQLQRWTTDALLTQEQATAILAPSAPGFQDRRRRCDRQWSCRILRGEPKHQVADLSRRGRTARPVARVGPAAGHQLAAPARQPRRVHQERRPPPRWKHPRECREHGSIRSRRGRVSCRRNTITSWPSTSSSMSLAAFPRARRTISSSTRRSTSYTTETHHSRRSSSPSGQEPARTPGHNQHQHSEARHGSSVEPAKSGSPLGDSG
jgi:hypothetical protein